MLVPYDDFYRKFFEARGVGEAEGRECLDIMVAMMDEFVIKGLEKALGEAEASDSDPPMLGVEWDQSTSSTFNRAARQGAAGKKEI